jgi:predicted amidohydrolase
MCLTEWENRLRNIEKDNQVYTIGTAPARDAASGYISWGHSMIVSPWGDVLRELDEKEGYINYTLDLRYVDQVRKELPLLLHRRMDIYRLEENNQ